MLVPLPNNYTFMQLLLHSAAQQPGEGLQKGSPPGLDLSCLP